MLRRMLVIAAMAVAGSQAGHLLVYLVRFGSAAAQVQSSSAHTYFPALARTTLGAAALALVAALLLVGLARVLTGRRLAATLGRSPYMSLLAALFTIQLACFVAQELTEAAVAGVPGPPLPVLLLWGTLGQLPVAAVAATALAWLWSRVASAAGALAALVRASVQEAPPRLELALVVATPDRGGAVWLTRASFSALVKRGPPVSSRSSR